MKGINTEKAVAKNWGIIIEYTFGDCSSTDNDLINEYAKENEKSYQQLRDIYGLNWEKTFRNEVLLNSNSWFINIRNKEQFFDSDTLNLNNENQASKIEFIPNRTFILSTDLKTNDNQKFNPIIYNGYYTIEKDEINLFFQDGTTILFKYDIPFQKGIVLSRKK